MSYEIKTKYEIWVYKVKNSLEKWNSKNKKYIEDRRKWTLNFTARQVRFYFRSNCWVFQMSRDLFLDREI